MMRSLPSLSSLAAFEVTARHLSFTKAAQEMNLTQGAVSKQVGALESRLGAQLFERRAQSLELTAAGRQLLPSLQEILLHLTTLIGSIGETDGATPLEIRVPPTLAMHWLIPRVQEFRRRRPDIELRLRTSLGATLTEYRSAAKTIDVGIVRLRADELASVPDAVALMRDDHVLVCSPNLARSLQDLGGLRVQTFLHAITRPNAWRDWLIRAGETHCQPAGELHFDHYHFALKAAADGVGVAVAPFPMVVDLIAAGALQMPFSTVSPSGSGYYFVFEPLSSNIAMIREFESWIREVAEVTDRRLAELAS